MLQKLMAMPKAKLSALVQSIDEKAVKGRAMRRQLSAMKRKEGGFTLLELLVVVLILAAVAGTATVMLQDADRKAAAGAHVAMMDELSKGIQVFRVANQGNYPNNWDSLFQNAAGALTGAAALEILNSTLVGNLTASTYTAADITALTNVGITTTRVVDTSADGCTAGGIAALIRNKANNVVAQNIFKPAIGTLAAGTRSGGCGATSDATMATADPVFVWAAGQESRVNAASGTRLVAFGVGPDATLFDPSRIGALSNTPVYRHVQPFEYNRFVVLFNTTVGATTGQATFHAIIDGAGDTKDEELGELDNVRRT